jgi:hypothetical protein
MDRKTKRQKIPSGTQTKIQRDKKTETWLDVLRKKEMKNQREMDIERDG